jgi:hypothetical protein
MANARSNKMDDKNPLAIVRGSYAMDAGGLGNQPLLIVFVPLILDHRSRLDDDIPYIMRVNYKTVLFGMMILLRIWGVGDEARQLGYVQRKHKDRAVLFWSDSMISKFASNAVAEATFINEVAKAAASGEVSYLGAATTQCCENLFGALVRAASGNLTFSNCQATLRRMLTTQAMSRFGALCGGA